MKRAALLTLSVLLAFATLSPAWAQGTQTYGPYQLHFSAIPSGLLNPEVARERGILRSRVRGVLMISVRHQEVPVHALVRVTATDGDGRDVPVELRRLREGNNVSYLGTFPIRDGQTVRFQLEVTPEGSNELLRAGFSQQFFVD